jgi:transglutaminase-like putative cysteine protease
MQAGNSIAAGAAGQLPAVQRYFEVSLFLLITTSVLTLVTTGKLDAVATVLPVLALAVKALRYRRGLGPELSHGVATLLVIAYLFFFPFDLMYISRGMAEGAPNPVLYAALLSTIHLMLFALIVRLYSARTTRDHLFLTLLAFATILVAAILTVDTLFLIFFLVFLVLAVSTFMAFEMRRSAEGAVTPPMALGTPTARRLHKALGITSTAVAFGALVLGAVIFFILPRYTAGYLSGLNLQPTLISGFSDDVELGQIGIIKKDTAVVMRVRVEGDPAQAANVYWRGIALTSFDGRRWYSAAREPEVVQPDIADGRYHLDVRYSIYFRYAWTLQLVRQHRRLDYTVILEPLATNTLFAVAEPRWLQGRFAPEPERGGRPSRRVYLLVDKTGSVSNPFHSYTRILYTGASMVPTFAPEELRTSPAEYPQEILNDYLQLPRLDPRIPELARQITATAATPYDKARAIERHLRTRFGYTLDLADKRLDDPLAYFLFERREGHCEYFAAAMTVMLRALGIPARLVNGFLPGEYNDVGHDFIIRASDAHSWVEVYFPEFGWVIFDPTPPSDQKARGWLGRLGFYWDWFELMWSEWVINYDLRHQQSLATSLLVSSRVWSARLRAFIRQKHRATVDAFKHWQEVLEESLSASPVIFAVLALLIYVLIRRRAILDYLAVRWGLRIGTAEKSAPRVATLYYQQMLRLLERRGLRKAPGQTALEFAASISLPELTAPVGEMTEVYQAARFGGRLAEADQMPLLLATIKGLLRPRRK